MINEDLKEYAQRISKEINLPIFLREEQNNILVEIGDSFRSAKYICLSKSDCYTLLDGVSIGYKVTNKDIQ